MVEVANKHRHIPPLVPPLRPAAHLHTLLPAATTLTEATYPALSTRQTCTEKGSHERSRSTCIHMNTHKSCFQPQAQLHRVIQRLQAFSATNPHLPLSHRASSATHIQLHHLYFSCFCALLLPFSHSFFSVSSTECEVLL